MPFVESRLISPTTLTTSASSALYTVPTGYSAIIKQLVVTNITGTAATFTFYIGAASAGNALFSATSVAANDTVIINLSQVISTGETLRALASTGSALNLTVSGVINDGPLASTATYIPDNAITSAKIADGAIVNADIFASAAIDQSKIANLTSDLALKAPLASPTLTGTPLAPTAAAGTNTTQLATTAFANTSGGLVFIKSQVIGSGVSSVQVTDAFSTNYDNYKIVVSGGASSQQTSIYMILGASTGTYYGVYLYANYSTGTPQGAAINNQANFIYAGGADIAALNVNIELQNPFLAKYTNIQALTVNYASIRGSAYGEHETASSYTSFTLAPYAGTLTGGTISVYGYRK